MSRNAMPSAVPSFRFTCVRRMRPKRSFCTTGATRARAQKRRSSSCPLKPPDSSGTSGPRLGNRRPNPWFCAVISTRPVSRFMTGWLPPRWPNFSFSMAAPAALLIIWCPRQMPNTGTLPRSFSTWVYVPSTASGSPGPFDRNTPSGRSGQHLFGRRVPRHHREIAARAHEVVQDGASSRRSRRRPRKSARAGRRRDGERMALRQVVGATRRGGCAHDTVAARFCPTMDSLARTFASRLSSSSVHGREHGALGAMVAHVAHERARVHAFDGDHAVLGQVCRASVRSLRQFEGAVHRSRTTSPRRAGRVGLAVVAGSRRSCLSGDTSW